MRTAGLERNALQRFRIILENLNLKSKGGMRDGESFTEESSDAANFLVQSSSLSVGRLRCVHSDAQIELAFQFSFKSLGTVTRVEQGCNVFSP